MMTKKINNQKSSGWLTRVNRLLIFTVLLSIFMHQGLYGPNAASAATLTYGLRTDASTNVGVDGVCNMTETTTPTAKTTMVSPVTTAGTSYRPTTGMANGTPVTLIRSYGPVYASAQTITAPAGSFAIRGYNSADAWTFHVYKYNPAGAANNKTLMYSSNTTVSGTGSTVRVVPAYTLVDSAMPAGYRLLVEVVYTPGGSTLTPRVYLDGTSNTAWSQLTVTETAAAAATTTVGNGTNPGNATLAPGGAATMLDAFTLQTSSGTDIATGLTVALNPAGAFNNIALVEITNDAGSTVYGSVANPASNTVAITFGTNITATTTATQYKVRITPKTHAAMPAVPGASYAVTGTVTALTSPNTKTYSDTASATVTIDNASPANATIFSGTPGNTQVVLTWTNPADADFSTVTILRNTAAIANTPAEGTTYVQGNTIGTSTVRYAGALATFTDTALSNGTNYYYRIFAKDTNGNYSSGGVQAGPHTPFAADAVAPSVGAVTPTGNVSATHVGSTVTLSSNITEANTLSSCQYCASTATPCTTWVAGVVGGSAPNWTCTATGITTPGADPNPIYMNMRGTDNSANVGTGTETSRIRDTTLPSNGTGTISVTAGNTQNTLDWAATGFADAASGLRSATTYSIRFQTVSAPANCTTGSLVPGYAGGTSVTHTGLTNGTTYGYRVCAYDNVNNGPSAGATGTGAPVTGPANTLTITTNTPGATTASDTKAFVVMQNVRADSDTVALTDNAVVLNSVTIDDIGTATAVAAVRVYIATSSTTTLPANAVLIGKTSLWSAATATAIPLNAGTVADRTVTSGVSKYIYIVYDMAAGQATRTVRSQVTGVGVSGGDIGVTGLALNSNVITLSAGVNASITLCTQCHTNPPVDSATRAAATGLFRGSHDKHAGAANLNLACTKCHSDNITTGHRAGYINMADPTIYGGTYSKAGGPTYSFAQSSNPIMGTCNNVSCHTTVQGANGVGAGTDKPQTWAAAGPLACGTCHADMAGAGATGRHVKHTNSTAGNYNFACSKCHAGYTASSAVMSTHSTGTIEVTLASGSYSGGTTPGNHAPGGGYGTCSTNYCHSTVQSATGGSPATYLTPTWGGSVSLGCGGCHKNMVSDVVTSGSHSQHTQNVVITCATCHNGFGTEITVNVVTHTDGAINLGFTGNAAGTTYQLGNTILPGAGYGNCTTNNCHGTTSKTWGANTASAQCTKCHGVPNTSVASYATDSKTASPGYNGTGVDTAGNTAATGAKVGAHDTHLRGLNNYSNPIACNNCHTVPASVDVTGADGHLNGGSAELIFSGLSTSNSAATAGYVSPNCTNTYCHFGKSIGLYSPAVTSATVSWTNTGYLTGTPSLTGDCGKCHASPPSTTGSHGGVNNINQCNGCHNHVSATGTFSDKTKHINGAVEVSADCVSCHSSTKAISAGPLAGGTRRAAALEFANTWSHKRSAGGAVTKYDCIVCHMEGDMTTGSTTASHANGYIDLRDPDTGTTIQGAAWSGAGAGSYVSTGSTVTFARFSRNLAGAALEPAVQAIMLNQCLKCHDANGALSASARVPTTGTAEKPFGTTIAGAGYTGAGVTANGVLGGVTDINAAFATTNSSYHPVRGKQNNSYTQGARMVAPWNMAKTNGNNTQYGNLISCWDCHALSTDTGTITQTVTAHGAAATLRGVATVTGTPAASTNQVTFCIVCHAGYNSSTLSHHGTGSALASSTNNSMVSYLRYGCNYCHSSSINAVRPTRAENVHGVNRLPGTGTDARWPTGATETSRPYAFIRNTVTPLSLTNHRPLTATGELTTGSAQCSAPGTTSPCADGMGTYTPGGVY